MSFHLKDPGATLDYSIDWGSQYLAEFELLADEVARRHHGGRELVRAVDLDGQRARRHRRPYLPAGESDFDA